MSIRRGFYGGPWDTGTLVPASEPRADVGDAPTVFDFTDEPSGPFPGTWEFFSRFTEAGVVTGQPEPAPFPEFFRVEGGLAWFDYAQHPQVGDYEEQGYAAAPTGIVLGKNCDLAAVFVSPPLLLDIRADSFEFELALVARATSDLSGFVGARVRASFAAGVWTTPVALEIVRGAGAAPVVLAAFTFDPTAFRALLDVWQQARAELRVVLREGSLTATLNGVWSVTAPVASDGGTKVGIFVKAYSQRAGSRTTLPSVAAFQLRTLRALGELAPAEIIAGQVDGPGLDTQMLLPLADLTAKGFFKRRGGRQWIATQDVTVTRPFSPEAYKFTAGAIVRAVEPFVGQDLVPCVYDLATMRALREGGS